MKHPFFGMLLYVFETRESRSVHTNFRSFVLPGKCLMPTRIYVFVIVVYLLRVNEVWVVLW